VIGDKAYITSDRIPLQIITPKRTNMTGFNAETNRRVAAARIHVERFFGRFKCTWKLMATKYRRSFKLFDRDFDILVALTNRLITTRPQPTNEELNTWASLHTHLKQRQRLEYIRKKARTSKGSPESGEDGDASDDGEVEGNPRSS
jgi:hypothetical protein